MEIFANFLQGCTNLVSLNVQGNSLGELSAEKIGNSLQACENLKYLNIDNNQIGNNGIISLTKTLLFSSK